MLKHPGNPSSGNNIGAVLFIICPLLFVLMTQHKSDQDISAISASYITVGFSLADYFLYCQYSFSCSPEDLLEEPVPKTFEYGQSIVNRVAKFD